MKNNHNDQNKIGFRQWKSGKQWLFAGAALLSLGVVATGAVELPGIGKAYVYAAEDAPTPPYVSAPTGDAKTGLFGTITVGPGMYGQPVSRNIAVGASGKITASYSQGVFVRATDILDGATVYSQWYRYDKDTGKWEEFGTESTDKNNISMSIPTDKEGKYYYQVRIQTRYYKHLWSQEETIKNTYWSDVSSVNVTQIVKANSMTIAPDDSLLITKDVAPSTQIRPKVDPDSYTGVITWEITDGGNLATINDRGVLTVTNKNTEGTVKVKATLTNDDGSKVYANTSVKLSKTLDVNNQTVFEKGDATFTLTGLPKDNYTVQWYENGIKIDGATGDSYIKKNAQASDNGKKYTAQVKYNYTEVSSTGKETLNTLVIDSNQGTLTVIKSYTVKINFVDEKGNAFSKDVDFGSTYETNPITDSTYVFLDVKAGSSPVKGTVGESDINITYEYKKADRTLSAVPASGKTIITKDKSDADVPKISDITIPGDTLPGSSVEVDVENLPDISGYKTPEIKNGKVLVTLSDEGNFVTLPYVKQLTTNWIDKKDSSNLKDPETGNKVNGDTTTGIPDSYKLVDTKTSDWGDVTYYYEKSDVQLPLQPVDGTTPITTDKDGKDVPSKSLPISGYSKEGDEVTIKASDIPEIKGYVKPTEDVKVKVPATGKSVEIPYVKQLTTNWIDKNDSSKLKPEETGSVVNQNTIAPEGYVYISSETDSWGDVIHYYKVKTPDANKDGLQESINKAKDLDSSKATPETQTELDDAKSKADEINNKPDATQQEVDDAKTKLDEAIKKVEEETNKADKDALDKKKEEAKKEINELPNLTPGQKEDFDKKVDGAKTPEEIDNIVDEAKKQDQANKDKADKDALDKAKEDAKKEIDTLPNTSKEDKDKAKDAIDGAKDKDAVDKIVDDAKKKDDSTKPTASSSSTSTSKPVETSSTSSGTSTSKPVETSSTSAGTSSSKPGETSSTSSGTSTSKPVETSSTSTGTSSSKPSESTGTSTGTSTSKPNESTGTSSSTDSLDKKKDEAKKEIDKLPNLTPGQKEDFDKKVDDAKTPEEIDKIVDDAKKQDQANKDDKDALDKKKDDAKNDIDKLPNLTPREKDDFKKKVDGATSNDAIKKIVKEAQKLNDSRKNKGGSGNNGGSNSNKSGNTKKNLPSTGEVAGSAGLVGIALASIAGFLGLARKKREDEE